MSEGDVRVGVGISVQSKMKPVFFRRVECVLHLLALCASCL